MNQKLKRIFRHAWVSRLTVRKLFPKELLDRIETEIAQAEQLHQGQIVFAVEADLSLSDLLKNKSARDRALEVFGSLRVWDTEHNNGVLLYVLVADRQIEIVADRGINDKVNQEVWERVCLHIEQQFRAGELGQGVTIGIAQIAAVLREHFPGCASGGGVNGNELANEPKIL